MQLKILKQHFTERGEDKFINHMYGLTDDGQYVRIWRTGETENPEWNTMEGFKAFFVRIAMEEDFHNSDDWGSYDSDLLHDIKQALEYKDYDAAFDFAGFVIMDLYTYPEMSQYGLWEIEDYETP